MEVLLTPEALQFLQEKGEKAITISTVLFASCCSGPLPPEAKAGAPADSDGFTPYPVGDVTVYFDSLLDPRPQLLIDLMDYGLYRELAVMDWE